MTSKFEKQLLKMLAAAIVAVLLTITAAGCDPRSAQIPAEEATRAPLTLAAFLNNYRTAPFDELSADASGFAADLLSLRETVRAGDFDTWSHSPYNGDFYVKYDATLFSLPVNLMATCEGYRFQLYIQFEVLGDRNYSTGLELARQFFVLLGNCNSGSFGALESDIITSDDFEAAAERSGVNTFSLYWSELILTVDDYTLSLAVSRG